MEKASSVNLLTIGSLSNLTTIPIPVPPREVPAFEGSSHTINSPTVANSRHALFSPSLQNPTTISSPAINFFSPISLNPDDSAPPPCGPNDSAQSSSGRLNPLPALKIG